MQFWFVHSGEISIREQIVTQITLGVLSGELSPGDRLPSTRDLARRFHLHANTVSAAYRQLEAEGWVESRHGSGVFVRDRRPSGSITPASSTQLLQHLFGRFLHSARKLEIPTSEVREFLSHWMNAPKPSQCLLIEPRGDLREIVLTEIQQAIAFPISACAPDDAALTDKLAGAIVLTLPSQTAAIRKLLPAGTELIPLQVRSAAGALAQRLPVRPDALIGVASAWPQFLETTRTMLIATGIAPEALVVRNTTEAHWQDALSQTAAVICDVVTAARLPKGVRAMPFPVLSETAIDGLKARVQATGLLPPHATDL